MSKATVSYSEYRRIADEMNLSDYRVAKLSKVSKQTISDWKTNAHQPSLATIFKIADCLGMTIGFIKKDKKNAS